MEVGDSVWTIYDPRCGLLPSPELDYVKDCSDSTGGALLEIHNGMNDEECDHWTNDFWGNLVDPNYLYDDCHEAVSELLRIRRSQLFELERKAAGLRQIIAGLE